jgi:DNA-binding IclR family transcriptional regulator
MASQTKAIRAQHAAVTRRPGRPTTRDPESAGSSTLLMGIELLKTIARMPSSANLSDIARHVGWPVSRVHRYVTTLVQTGLLSHSPNTGHYGLGTAAIEIGVAAMSKTDALQIASDIMRELTARTSLVSVLAVWGSHGPTVVRWEVGRLEAAIRVREGINLSLVTTAAGQIFLAFREPHEIAAQLERDIQTWNDAAPIAKHYTKAKVKALRDTVRKRGIAPLVAAISAPIFDRGGLVMSLTLTGIQGSFDGDFSGEPARHLMETADKISMLLGGGGFMRNQSAVDRIAL